MLGLTTFDPRLDSSNKLNFTVKALFTFDGILMILFVIVVICGYSTTNELMPISVPNKLDVLALIANKLL